MLKWQVDIFFRLQTQNIYRVSKKGYTTLIAIKVLIIIRSPQKIHTVSGTLLALICALIHVPTIFYLIVTKLNVKITSFENEHG